MLKDVTIGQYYNDDSVIHRLDPRVKIRFTIIYIILLLLDRNLVLFAMLTAFFLGTMLLSKVPLAHMVKGTKSIFIFVIICSAISIFSTPGDVVAEFFFLDITKEGIVKFGFLVWRMVLMILASSIIMYTTTPTELTDGLEKCFHLSGSVAMSITIALRFVAVLFEELDRIMKAQEARGVQFDKGGPLRRLKSMSTVVIPLFQNAIDRAGNLGEAMDARCYTGGKGRTKLKPLSYDIRDVVTYIIMLGILILGIWLAVKW